MINWAQKSKRNLNLWLKSRNKKILSTILLNRISHLALERVIRSKDKNTYLMLQVNINNTFVKFISYE